MMFKVFEMVYSDQKIEPSGIVCGPFEEKFIQKYKEAYNAAFRPMREALDRKPYDWYSDDEEIVLHVAEWNGTPVKMYLDAGFTIRKEEEV